MSSVTIETGPQSAAEFLVMRAAEAALNKANIAGVMVIQAYVPATDGGAGPVVLQIWGGTEQGQVELLRKLANELEAGGGRDMEPEQRPTGRVN